jgi:hypothetical protein
VRILKVSRRGGFSDRNKIKPENEEIQLLNFDSRTRTQLQNFVSQVYVRVYDNSTYYGNSYIQNFLRFVLGTIYSEKVDATKYCDDKMIWKCINSTIENDSYDDVLTLIESLAQYWDSYTKEIRGCNYYNDYSGYTGASIYEAFNAFFQREYIGYRFVGNIITSISDENEVESINDAIAVSDTAVRAHLLKANFLLADREKPDYENSIKESISAVEAFCEIKTGIRGKEATLGKMLKKLEDSGIEIHSALKSAFNILYGYTSDANGIRHAGDIGGAASTFEEAKFMLVSCCAFINYLTAITAD